MCGGTHLLIYMICSLTKHKHDGFFLHTSDYMTWKYHPDDNHSLWLRVLILELQFLVLSCCFFFLRWIRRFISSKTLSRKPQYVINNTKVHSFCVIRFCYLWIENGKQGCQNGPEKRVIIKRKYEVNETNWEMQIVRVCNEVFIWWCIRFIQYNGRDKW